MDIHNFPSMPSEPDSTAACRFSSWNIMGHSHGLVEKLLKTLRCIQDSSSGSSGGRKFDISMSQSWNVLKCLEPKRSYDEHVFVFCVFSSEKYIIMRGCWLNFGEVIPCHTMSYPLFHAMPSLCKCSGCSAPTTTTSWCFRLANKNQDSRFYLQYSPIFSILYTWLYMYF